MAGSSCHSPCRARVVAHQPGPDHGAVGVDDPSPRGPHRAVVGLGVGDLFAAIEDAGPAAHARLRQPGRPQARFPHRAAIRRHLDFAVETEAAHAVEIYSGSTLYDEIAAHGSCPSADPGRADSRRGVKRRARRGDGPGRRGPPRRGSPGAARRRGTGGRSPPGCAAPSPAAPGRCRCPPPRRPRASQRGQSRCRWNRSRRARRSGPASRRARCRATGAAVACCSASSVNSQSGDRPAPPASRRRGGAAASSPPAPAPGRRIGPAPRRHRRSGWRRSARIRRPPPAPRHPIPTAGNRRRPC